ncbi:Tetratricopeptide TPR_2 repeat protein [Gloeothece citriformis PCC 7424]|uniref:Tetratricopeptide TPR_2 repeat protein n=1 Tax=Gloeothece citriformis (strain PCC 7424) TaxID=65393 RepID=B7KHB0_GLOC7|nr:tetratricopeptide repeat protein [Gloeothece citriformis]ACK69319.1 Tetratricopeptide TPR_2 repeat protein [Gloeothece citriformis PCC 7424]
MKSLISSFLVVTIGLMPLSVPFIEQPSWAQTQTQPQDLQQLLESAIQQTQQGQLLEAIETLQHLLTLARQQNDRETEALALLWLGFNSYNIAQPQQTLEFFQQALPIFQAVGDRRGEANTLSNMGDLYKTMGQPQKASLYYLQALPILREVGDQSLEGTTLINLADVYNSIGKPQQALEYYNQALPIMQETGDRDGEATTLNNIGIIYRSIGQPQNALKYYTQALPILRDTGNRSGEASTLNNLGVVYRIIGQTQNALEYYTQALSILRDTGNPSEEAGTLNNLGSVYASMGKFQEGLAYYKEALSIFREIGNRNGEAMTLSNLGEVYRSIGQPQKALAYYNKALPISRESSNPNEEATILNNLGLTYASMGQSQKALEYYTQVLLIFRETGNRRGEATTLMNLGGVYDNFRQPEQSLEFYTQALPILREIDDRSGEGITLNNLGGVYRSMRQPQRALEFYKGALSIFREISDRSGEAITLTNIGSVYQDLKQTHETIKNWKESIDITLKIRGNLVKENRKEFLQAQPKTVIALTNLLIEQNKPEEAYEWFNLATTFELADYTRLINAKVSNPQAQQLIDQWTQKNQQLNFLRQQLQEDFSESLAQRMRELEAEVNKEAEEIVLRFPEVADLFETTPTDIAQLRESIPKGTTVIHPVLLTGIENVPDTIAIFVITRDNLTVTKVPLDSTEFDNLITTTYQKLNNRFDSEFVKNLAPLYDVLIRPIEAQLTPNQPISIIATGKLRYLPFEALCNLQGEEECHYLIQNYSINYLTRLSTRQIPVTQNPTSKPKILAIGNPKSEGILALNGAEEEVKRITTILPESQSYIREKATLETFKIQSTQFTLLHLATHGCFNPKGCCLSSNCDKPDLEPNSILFADRSFNIADAATLGLKDVELITLSACQTALETNSNGQEISGVAYLFERAGAKAVIASLWSAEDGTTKAIMEEFYQNIKSGMSQAEALQKAKLSQIESHPWYWSPFILIGNTNRF